MVYIAKIWFFANSNKADKHPKEFIKRKKKKTQMTSNRKFLKGPQVTCSRG